jgi:PAS domain-containing protein
MLIADDDGRYEDGNQAALGLLGITHDHLLRLAVMDILPSLATREAWHRLLAKGVRGELTLQRPDGESRLVELRARPNILPHRHLSVLRDITRWPRPSSKTRP